MLNVKLALEPPVESVIEYLITVPAGINSLMVPSGLSSVVVRYPKNNPIVCIKIFC
jgi:hypothetical protein